MFEFIKRLLLSIILVLAFGAVHSQEITDSHINKADIQGRKQGVWRVYDDDGNLKYTGSYHNGKPIGTFTYYYPNNKVKAVINFLDSGAVAYAKDYYKSGFLMAEGKYVNQKKDSTWLYYSETDGTLSAEEHYVNSLKDGVWKTFYPNGQVADETIYRDDKKEGPWTQFFTDGKIKMKAAYINDKLEGQYIIYHLNGMVNVSGSYMNNEKNGTWVYFKDTGEMEQREEYDHGRLVSQENMNESSR